MTETGRTFPREGASSPHCSTGGECEGASPQCYAKPRRSSSTRNAGWQSTYCTGGPRRPFHSCHMAWRQTVSTCTRQGAALSSLCAASMCHYRWCQWPVLYLHPRLRDGVRGVQAGEAEGQSLLSQHRHPHPHQKEHSCLPTKLCHRPRAKLSTRVAILLSYLDSANNSSMYSVPSSPRSDSPRTLLLQQGEHQSLGCWQAMPSCTSCLQYSG